MKHKDLGFDYFNALFILDKDKGCIYWREGGHGRQMKIPVGSADSRGYLTATVNYVRYRIHNIVWLLHTGNWPVDQLDHINNNKSDNRPENLREVNQSLNNYNYAVRPSNPYGVKGIYQMPNGKYRVSLGHKVFGYFYDLSEAIAKRKSLEENLFNAQS